MPPYPVSRCLAALPPGPELPLSLIALHVEALLARAKAVAPLLAAATTARKDAFIGAVADLLVAHSAAIAAANARDLALAADRPDALRDRLRLDASAIARLAATTRDIAQLPDPVGVMTSTSQRPNGLTVQRQRVPLGVIGIIYEARPNVTVDAAVLAIKAGNAVILRGGSEAQHTNAALCQIVRAALGHVGLPADALQMPETTDRAVVDALVGRKGGLDLVIPRGGPSLIAAVSDAARVPVIQHYQGVCHVYIDGEADLAVANAIVINAKTSRPGVCNAMEALLIDATIAPQAVPLLTRALAAAGVQVRACQQTQALAGDQVVPAQASDYGQEFLDMICLCVVVDGLDGALHHIAQFGSHHTEAIVTTNAATAEQFVNGVDASCAIVNASTRFNDGSCLGLGAEIGISTTKIHAYGPMGLEALTTERFVVRGQGQVRT